MNPARRSWGSTKCGQNSHFLLLSENTSSFICSLRCYWQIICLPLWNILEYRITLVPVLWLCCVKHHCSISTLTAASLMETAVSKALHLLLLSCEKWQTQRLKVRGGTGDLGCVPEKCSCPQCLPKTQEASRMCRGISLSPWAGGRKALPPFSQDVLWGGQRGQLCF